MKIYRAIALALLAALLASTPAPVRASGHRTRAVCRTDTKPGSPC